MYDIFKYHLNNLIHLSFYKVTFIYGGLTTEIHKS